eukprot:COSAG01_NODE_1689_length_9488_cov_5.759825_8_plen_81_part_00
MTRPTPTWEWEIDRCSSAWHAGWWRLCTGRCVHFVISKHALKKGGCAGWLPQDKMFEQELGYPKRTQRLCLDAADAAGGH